MTTRKGSISVKTNDIFPIIKKWLYSEHDIFTRELVSNACDAITKRSTLARTAGYDVPEGKVRIEVDKDQKFIRISDNGLGLTEEEVEKYIAQLAFSGAEEFVQKMKSQGVTSTKDEIIGKFGLGFYSAFMVADKVEVESLSMTPGATPTKWTCHGDTDYEFSESHKTEVGTEITLHMNADAFEFLDMWKIRETVARYCDFMPYPIAIINKNDAEAKEDIINETSPLWKKDPTTVTEQEYKDFYRKLFPMDAEPLFWLHLNVDHPFTLQGILYFPKVNPSKPVVENGVKLYSKQVFVSDNIKNIMPDFLSLLKGAIDSTDIPLNVSRSALQGDPNIKKISNYIIKKVAESLKKLFNNDRERYNTAWEDIGLFVKYGCVQDNKFDEMMRGMVLFRNSDGKLVTLGEYQGSIPEAAKEKLKNKFVYFEKGASDEALRKQLLLDGIHVIETDSYIDPHFMQHSEMTKINETDMKFVSIDSEIENLLETAAVTDTDMKIQELFQQTLVGTDKELEMKLGVEIKSLKGSTSAAYYKIDENMKRFQQMAKSMGPNAFQMPLKKTLVVNPSHPLIKNAFKLWDKGEKKELATKMVHYVQDLAMISSEGLSQGEKEKFVTRSQDLVQELSNLAL